MSQKCCDFPSDISKTIDVLPPTPQFWILSKMDENESFLSLRKGVRK